MTEHIIKHITFLVKNQNGEILHCKKNNGKIIYYFIKKIVDDDLVPFCCEQDAKDLIVNFQEEEENNMKIEPYFFVDNVLEPLDEIANFISERWDGDRIDIDNNEN